METTARSVLEEMLGALDQEITAERSGRNRTRIPLADGRLLGQLGGATAVGAWRPSGVLRANTTSVARSTVETR